MCFRLLTVLGIGVAVVLSACDMAGGQTGATAATGAARKWPIESATADQKAMFAQIKPLLLKNSRKAPLVLAKSSESYFWFIASRLNPMIDAYEYSGDPEFLEVFVSVLEAHLKQRYRHPTKPKAWSGWWHYGSSGTLYYMPIHGAISYYTPALKFVRAVRADTKLKTRYGKKAEAWFKEITEIEIPAWDKRGSWHDLKSHGGYYTHVTHYPDARTGKIAKRTDAYGGSTLAYNKVHELIESLCLAYQLTGDPWYRERIEKCERFFRKRWREDDKHVEWNYRDFSGSWDYDPSGAKARRGASNQFNGRKTRTGYFIHPKGGYYAADLQAIVVCYNVGITFTRSDIEKLIKTNLEFMWMGDPANSKFRKINGTYTAEGKYGKGYLWTALAQFSPKVRELWKARLSRRSYGWEAGTLAYLKACARPVSWQQRHLADIPKRR